MTTEMLALAIGFVSGVLVTAAFGEKVKNLIVGLLTKTAAKIGNKS